MKLEQTGSVFDNHGLWYYAVKLPGEKKRRIVPLKAPNSNHTMHTDRPRKMAEQAAARYWETMTRSNTRQDPSGLTVNQLVSAWDAHCKEYYRDANGELVSTATNAVTDVRMFRDIFGHACLSELTHADMLTLRDALVRSGMSRKTINTRLWRVKHMIEWALDEALITAQVKAELTQVKGIQRGRTSAPERRPVRSIDDATIYATAAKLLPNTAAMVKVHRLTGMRPCELCAMRWRDIDTSALPWVYRVPADANKNAWRGEFGVPRVVCLGPKARAILQALPRVNDFVFSPKAAMVELVANSNGQMRSVEEWHRIIGERWDSAAYYRTVKVGAKKAGVTPWGVNRLRHTFGTEVRRAYGLDVAKAVLGHTDGGCITDDYTFEAVEEEFIKKASPAVEALG